MNAHPISIEAGDRRFRVFLIATGLVLFSAFVVGLFSLATSPLEIVTLTLAYTSGLSMIVLPCTLPAVFVIVPLSLGRSYRRGFTMALLFGLGLALTITAYGVAVAYLGQILYLDKVTLLMWLTAGVAAYIFGLSELGLIPWRAPSYSGPLPGVIQQRGDYLKAFGMGLLLGNAGIGCPNPAFYVLLTYIAGSGSVPTGLAYGLIHGVGRATPLLALSVLAILGVNATGWLSRKRERIEKLIGWGLIGFAALLIPKGYLFGHAYWEESAIHKVWNKLVHLTLGANIAESAAVEKALGDMPVHDPWLLYGPWVVIALLVAIPILWNDWKRAGALQSSSVVAAKVGGLMALLLLWPIEASAHGDDTVNATSFLGPLLAIGVFVSMVGLGRSIIRAIKETKP
ncbi:MAG TPA: cytochrome c biogenesis protein CcdA [Methylomirabilota bacterium]|nr:cytochrome c biogenesis protein CcdA [Methylomirabilota bacterium]